MLYTVGDRPTQSNSCSRLKVISFLERRLSWLQARGIEDGRIDGDKISFIVRFQAASEGMTSEHRNRYIGTVSGNQIHFRMQDDRGNPPVEFVAGKENGTE
jgi:hypothetical protein